MSIEGPVEVYLRARSDVLKSLFDGIDTVDSAATYRFALRNLQRHDAVYITKSDDVMARVFSDMVLSKAVSDLPQGPYNERTEPAISVAYGDEEGEGEVGLIHGAWPQMSPTHDLMPTRNSEQMPYGTHHPFSESIHPLREGNHFVEVLRDYYLRPDPNTESLAEKEAKAELAHQERWNKSSAFDNNFLGSLQDDQSAHHHYDTDFLRWLKSKNIGPAELDDEMEHKLREEHFNDRAGQWTDGEHYEDENGMLHSRKLGWLGYNLGLEFMQPEERTEIIGNLWEHGSDREEAIPHMAAARLKRNFIARTAGEKDWMMRAEDKSGPNIPPIHEKIHGAGDVNLNTYTDAAQNTDTDDGDSVYERLLANHRSMVENENAPLPGYSGGEKFHENPNEFLTPQLFNMLAGLDEDGNVYEQGQHPIYGEKWKGSHVIHPSVIEEFQNKVKDLGGHAARQKDTRNAYLAYRNMFGPSPDFISQEGDLDYYKDAGNHSRTFASHWMEPFHRRGGLGRDHETYIDGLHDFLTTNYTPLEETTIGGPTHQSLSLIGHGFHETHPDDQTKRGRKVSSYQMKDISQGGLDIPQGLREQVALGEDFTPDDDAEMTTGTTNVEGLSSKRIQEDLPIIGFRPEMAGLLAPLHPTVYGTRYTAKRPVGMNPLDPEEKGQGTVVLNPKFAQQVPFGRTASRGGLILAQQPVIHGEMDPHEILDMGGASHAFVDENHNTLETPVFTNTNARAKITTTHAGAMQSRLNEESFGKRDPRMFFDGHGKMADMHHALPARFKYDPKDFESWEKEWLDKNKKDERKIEWAKTPEGKDELRRQHFDEQERKKTTRLDNMPDKLAHNLVLRTKMGSIYPPGAPMEGKILPNTHFTRQVIGPDGKKARMMSFDRVSPDNHATNDPVLHHELQGQKVSPDGIVTDPFEERFGASSYIKQHDKVLSKHMDAITNVAKKLRGAMEEIRPDFFERHKDNPQASLSNALQLFRQANLALLHVPHEVHGEMGHSFSGTDEYEHVKAAENPAAFLAQGVGEHKEGIVSQNMTDKDIMGVLGLDASNKHHQTIAQRVQSAMHKKDPMMAMTVNEAIKRGLLGGKEHAEDMDHIGDGLFDMIGSPKDRKSDTAKGLLAAAKRASNIITSAGEKHGLMRVDAPLRDIPTDKRRQKRVRDKKTGEMKIITGKKGGKTGDQSKKGQIARAARTLDSVVLFSPSGEVEPMKRKNTKYTWGEAPIDTPKPGGHSIHDFFDGPRLNWGWGMLPDYNLKLGKDGSVQIVDTPVKETPLMSVPNGYLFDVFPELEGMLTGNEHLSLPNALKQTKYGESARDVRPDEMIGDDGGRLFYHSEEIDTLGLLDNVFFKTPRPDPILPMHRIFNIDDLDSLRGFTGEWVVTSWPKGERIMLTRKGDNFTARTILNEKIEVPKQVQKDAKKSSEKDFVLDGMLHKKRFYVIDVLKVEDDDIHEMKATERVRLLRATFEPHEHFQPPSPSTLRTTDDDGLEDAIAELEQPILLRDAQSTYMRGELRHPKWVILQKGKKVDLIILDRSGTGPYTYRLGAGPIFDTEGLGPRAVKTKKHTYMDVGTVFRSPQRYEIGHTVKVTVASVKEKKQKGRSLFTVRGGKVHGEGDAPASIETLGILAKSAAVWTPTRISLEENFLKVELPHLENDVLYKMYPNELGIELQEPQVSLPDQNNSDYVIRLCEATRDDWEPVAAALLKSKKIAVKMSEKDRKKLAEPPKEVDNPEPHEPFLEPKIVPGTFHKPTEEDLTMKAALLAAKLMDRIAKERMATIGIESLAINHGTGEAAPRGPTTIDGGATMPDWDSSNSEYTEEKEAEEEREYERRKKEKNASVLNR